LDRFGTVAAILRRFASGELSPSVPEAWLEPLERAGIHPASLPLCCQGANFPWAEPLRQAVARLGCGFQLVPDINIDTIVAWSPLTYAHEIERWTLGTAAGLPDDLLAIRGVTVQDCPELLELGRGWTIAGRLHLRGLPRLQALRGPLELFGDLELEGLPCLRELGGGITVHGNLTVAGCPALSGFPPDLRVDGVIWMDTARPGLAGRVVSPWPGIQPRPVPIAGFPDGAVELATC